jgi:hypothetical protein
LFEPPLCKAAFVLKVMGTSIQVPATHLNRQEVGLHAWKCHHRPKAVPPPHWPHKALAGRDEYA